MSDTSTILPRAWVRKLPDTLLPDIIVNRWQSYIPTAHGQFELHRTQADALARIERHNLKVLLVEALS